MDAAKIFQYLLEELQETGMESRILEQDGVLTLRLSVPFTDEAWAGVMEITLISLADDVLGAQIYTTLTLGLEEGPRRELWKLIPTLNFYTLLGSFGIFQENQLYHKYGIAVTLPAEPKAVADRIGDALALVYGAVDGIYPLLRDVANGDATCEQALAESGLQPIFGGKIL